MNKLFETIRKKWNKLFKRYDIVKERKRQGSLSWTRFHIYQCGLFGRNAYLGYRLSVVDAISVVDKKSGGNCHVNIVESKK